MVARNESDLPIYEKYKSGPSTTVDSPGCDENEERTLIFDEQISSGDSKTLIDSLYDNNRQYSEPLDKKLQALRDLILCKGNKVVTQIKSVLNTRDEVEESLRNEKMVENSQISNNVKTHEFLMSETYKEFENSPPDSESLSKQNSASDEEFGIQNFAALFENDGPYKYVRFQRDCRSNNDFEPSSSPSSTDGTPGKAILKSKENSNQEIEMKRMKESDRIDLQDFVKNLQRKQVLRTKMNNYFSDVRNQQIIMSKSRSI